MNVVVFCGPSLTPNEARTRLGPEAQVLPPAAQGDVYRAARQRPAAIGVIDGYFERVPAVWHKEILWAMSQGVHVVGAASMGALRAAELAPFGMEGVGWIFEAFRTGVLTDDDEVAVAHGPADVDYRSQSEALVNMRQTVDAAVSAGVVSGSDGATIIQAAKSLFYPYRLWPTVLDSAIQSGLSPHAAVRLRTWLPAGRVDQKRLDAIALLDRLVLFGKSVEPKQVAYHFEHTVWWDHLAHHAGTGPEALSVDDVLDEVRLDEPTFARTYAGSLLRNLALEQAGRLGLRPDEAAVLQRANKFCWDNGIGDQARFEDWLAANDLSLAEFNQLMREEELVNLVAAQNSPTVVAQIPMQLRAANRFAALKGRARHKTDVLQAVGLDSPGLAQAGFATTSELYAWWFASQQRMVPDDVAGYVRSKGFADEASFQRAILREWCYLARGEVDNPA